MLSLIGYFPCNLGQSKGLTSTIAKAHNQIKRQNTLNRPQLQHEMKGRIVFSIEIVCMHVHSKCMYRLPE